MSEQLPFVTILIVTPDAVQTEGVVETRVTASPEEAVTLNANGAAPEPTPIGAT